ncbi:MAG: dihydroneopterin aldolase [Bacteroidetes bacterium]|nr:MAG: dihydroneopterin aldolase [Bacteroidota bacterium]
MGKISLEGMEFYSHHGYYKDEITRGNKFVVDLSFETDIEKAGVSDDLEDALNYEDAYNIVKAEMAIRSNLLEHAGSRIIKKLRAQFPEIGEIELKLSKYNPPLVGIVQKVSVTIKD